MDDNQALVARAAVSYCCPGEAHAIDRATHLGRLAAFFPACRHCPSRDDIRHLTPAVQRQWQQVLRRGPSAPRFDAEGLLADSVNDLGTKVAAHFAMALGSTAWRALHAGNQRPQVLVATNGHWTTAELMAAACATLELCGCRTIELGAATTAALTCAAQHAQADAACWIGGAAHEAHAICARAWGPAGRPWSSPGGLDRVRALYDGRTARPQRGGGGLERLAADDTYLAPLAPQFHGLRPLRFVLDTACAPFVQYLRRLTSDSACQVLCAAPGAVALAATPGQGEPTLVERRLAAVGRQVIAEHAHFGLWIDPAGERCRLVDERGRPASEALVCRALVDYVGEQSPRAIVVLEHESLDPGPAPGRAEVQLAPQAGTREGMFEAMVAGGATLGVGRGGAFWFESAAPCPDALLATSVLLTLFSRSDRAVSEVLDAAAEVG